MKQRQLGKNGPMISAIGIGAMSFSNFYGATDEAQSHAILATALDEGVTHIDTANAYGPHTSESVIGTFLARQGKSRNELFSIATKAAITKDPDTGARTFNNSAEHLESELDGSLARLGVDHVDLFYVHRRDLGIAEAPDFTLLDQPDERFGHLFDRNRRIAPMHIEQIDMVDTEPGERAVKFRFEMLGAVIEGSGARVRILGDGGLGRDAEQLAP